MLAGRVLVVWSEAQGGSPQTVGRTLEPGADGEGRGAGERARKECCSQERQLRCEGRQGAEQALYKSCVGDKTLVRGLLQPRHAMTRAWGRKKKKAAGELPRSTSSAGLSLFPCAGRPFAHHAHAMEPTARPLCIASESTRRAKTHAAPWPMQTWPRCHVPDARFSHRPTPVLRSTCMHRRLWLIAMSNAFGPDPRHRLASSTLTPCTEAAHQSHYRNPTNPTSRRILLTTFIAPSPARRPDAHHGKKEGSKGRKSH